MKNMVFTSSAVDVVNYLVQRENQFVVGLKLPENILRKENKGSGFQYECVLENFSTKTPISYRINVFFNENKVRLLLPTRTYTTTMKYASKYAGTCSFTFTFQEKLLEFMLVFDDYTNDIASASEIVDEQIESFIQEEVSSIFRGTKPDDKKEWRLSYKGKTPPCTFKEIHAF